MIFSSKSDGCPISLFSHELDPPLTGNRYGLQLFVLSGQDSNKWKRLPLQIDPVNDEGRLEFFKNEDWKRKNLGQYDRLVFLGERFGRRFTAKDRFPCKGKDVYEIRDKISLGKFAYLTNCPLSHNFSKLPEKLLALPSITHNEKEASLAGPNYKYQFSKKNQLLFERIDIGPVNSRTKIAENSDITIRADVKNFFNFNFTSKDIESYLEDVRVGEIGANARLSFYLKVFYLFTIKLKLNTDVSFYGDSANIPMVIHIPVDSKKHLNPGSGIIYSWEYDANKTKINLGPKIPELSDSYVKLIKESSDKIADIGKTSCRGSSICRYRLGMGVGDNGFVMDFKIRKSMVHKGFFPLFTDDVSKYNDGLNWDLNLSEKTKRAGVYFESSGLSEGSFPWDFWLRLGSESDLKHHCPRPVYIKNISKIKKKKRSLIVKPQSSKIQKMKTHSPILKSK